MVDHVTKCQSNTKPWKTVWWECDLCRDKYKTEDAARLCVGICQVSKRLVDHMMDDH